MLLYIYIYIYIYAIYIYIYIYTDCYFAIHIRTDQERPRVELINRSVILPEVLQSRQRLSDTERN